MLNSYVLSIFISGVLVGMLGQLIVVMIVSLIEKGGDTNGRTNFR